MLGHLALALAERLDALIDFDGLLRCPPSCDDTGDGVLREGAGPLLVSLPGRVTEVSYDSGDGGGLVHRFRFWLTFREGLTDRSVDPIERQ
ncbi:DUF6368 family protein [Streptomyces sp. NPDC053728]|uniref:DUF6368 family protein n=1 Tax=Streptomyces sp. NPDC053728 TaxID=3155534 RepID=UPI00342875C3